jgi:putative copper export protein
LNVDTADLSQRVNGFSISVRGLTVALVIAGMIIGSAIAASSLSALQSSAWGFLVPVGVIVFLGALLYGGFIAWRLTGEIQRTRDDGPYSRYGP